MKQSFITLFDRDIDRLYKEIAAYSSDDKLWELKGEILNTPGNLALHLCGNLNHFIGANLGNTGYVRDRDAEFATKDVSKADLLNMIEKAKLTVLTTLENLTDEQLGATYPLEPLGYPMTSNYFLIHLSGHLNYHLGQINYHRRLLQEVK
jgi:uncharacterized damage-inducible protein DinB